MLDRWHVELELHRRREPAAGKVLRHAELGDVESVTLGEVLELAGQRELAEQVRRVDRRRVPPPDAVEPTATDAVAVGLVGVVTFRVAPADAPVRVVDGDCGGQSRPASASRLSSNTTPRRGGHVCG
jgi:hypothetical protein